MVDQTAVAVLVGGFVAFVMSLVMYIGSCEQCRRMKDGLEKKQALCEKYERIIQSSTGQSIAGVTSNPFAAGLLEAREGFKARQADAAYRRLGFWERLQTARFWRAAFLFVQVVAVLAVIGSGIYLLVN